MVTKTGIVEQLGEQAVLLPALLGQPLAANDRIKLRLSLLQEAAQQARMPGRRPHGLGAALSTSGLGDEIPETFIANARLEE